MRRYLRQCAGAFWVGVRWVVGAPFFCVWFFVLAPLERLFHYLWHKIPGLDTAPTLTHPLDKESP